MAAVDRDCRLKYDYMQPDSVEKDAVDRIFIPPETSLIALHDDGINALVKLEDVPLAVSVRFTSLKALIIITLKSIYTRKYPAAFDDTVAFP